MFLSTTTITWLRSNYVVLLVIRLKQNQKDWVFEYSVEFKSSRFGGQQDWKDRELGQTHLFGSISPQ